MFEAIHIITDILSLSYGNFTISDCGFADQMFVSKVYSPLFTKEIEWENYGEKSSS